MWTLSALSLTFEISHYAHAQTNMPLLIFIYLQIQERHLHKLDHLWMNSIGATLYIINFIIH